jgi:hypothetical protein
MCPCLFLLQVEVDAEQPSAETRIGSPPARVRREEDRLGRHVRFTVDAFEMVWLRLSWRHAAGGLEGEGVPGNPRVTHSPGDIMSRSRALARETRDLMVPTGIRISADLLS